jgi:hypothetical protein
VETYGRVEKAVKSVNSCPSKVGENLMARHRPIVLTWGEGSFIWHSIANSTTIPVFYYLLDDPARLASNTQVVFAQHGVHRDAEDYRNDWRPIYRLNEDFILSFIHARGHKKCFLCQFSVSHV